MADIINVLNIDTPLTWISEVATSPNFAVANLIANPRRAMFALRYEF